MVDVDVAPLDHLKRSILKDSPRFRLDDRDHTAPDQGLVMVLPSPLEPGRVVYLVRANSALQLEAMTRTFRRDLHSWALFEGDEVVESGFHHPDRLEFRFAEEGSGR